MRGISVFTNTDVPKAAVSVSTSGSAAQKNSVLENSERKKLTVVRNVKKVGKSRYRAPIQ